MSSYFLEFPIQGYSHNGTHTKQGCTLRLTKSKMHIFSLLNCDITLELTEFSSIQSYSPENGDLVLVSSPPKPRTNQKEARKPETFRIELFKVPQEAAKIIQERIEKEKTKDSGPKMFSIKVKSPRGLLISSQMFRDTKNSDGIIVALKPLEKSALFEEFPETLSKLTSTLGSESDENQLWRDFWSKKLMKALFGTSKLNGKQAVHPMVHAEYSELNLTLQDLFNLQVRNYNEVVNGEKYDEPEEIKGGKAQGVENLVSHCEKERKEPMASEAKETNYGEKLRRAVDLGTDYSSTKAESTKWGKHEDMISKLNMISIQSFEEESSLLPLKNQNEENPQIEPEYDEKYIEKDNDNANKPFQKTIDLEEPKKPDEFQKKLTAKEKKNWSQFMKNLSDLGWKSICEMLVKRKSEMEYWKPNPQVQEESRKALRNLNIMQLEQ